MSKYTSVLLCLFVVAALAAGVIWRGVYAHRQGVLTVAFLDVGQGDSIYIESPTGTHVVVDSGATRVVLRRLREVMPLWDKRIDMIVGTHPDGDHVGGFPDILGYYDVGTVVYQHVEGLRASPADAFEQALVKWKLRREVRSEKREGSDGSKLTSQNSPLISGSVVEPHRGDVWDIGGGAYIQLLYPDRAGDPDDTNAGSVVARVVYGDTSFLLTGDAPQEVEEYLVGLYGEQLHSNVLKLGHHGSRTSTSPNFLSAVQPSYAIISRGCDNTYGHPHKDVVELVQNFKIAALDTCIEGTVAFTSNGRELERN